MRPARKTIIHYKYANGVVLTLSSIDPKLGGGATFIGDKGRITIFREGYECDPVGLDEDPLPPDATRVYQSDNHMENFFACVASRKDPIMNVEAGHSVATLCHLGNIARRLGRRLKWDPEKEIFPGDDEANQYHRLSETQRLRIARAGVAVRHPVELASEHTAGARDHVSLGARSLARSISMTWRFLAAAGYWPLACRDAPATRPLARRGRALGPVPSSRCPGGHVAGRDRPGAAAGAYPAALAAGPRRKSGGRGLGRSADRAGADQPGGRAEGLRIGHGQAGAGERLRPVDGDGRPASAST